VNTATSTKQSKTSKYTYNYSNSKTSKSSNKVDQVSAAQKARDAQKQKDERAKLAEQQVAMRPPWDNGNVYESTQELDDSGVNETIRQMSRDSVDKKLVYINISKQQFTALDDGQIVRQGFIATGRTKFPTIQGEFQIWDKKYKKVLRAPSPEYGKYELPVDYWMPFHKGYGLHDAWWRSTFGGQDYVYNGSHGCVNMQYPDSQWLFEWSNIGTTVFVSK
jgi:lipoprotein-anchoring transpeptidase ErfK/SrfK